MRSFSFLLTDRIENKKHEGKKHEVDYTLEMLKVLGIEAKDKKLFMPRSDESYAFVDRLLLESGIGKDEKIAVIHPSASCPSRIWPLERYAKVADKLIEACG